MQVDSQSADLVGAPLTNLEIKKYVQYTYTVCLLSCDEDYFMLCKSSIAHLAFLSVTIDFDLLPLPAF